MKYLKSLVFSVIIILSFSCKKENTDLPTGDVPSDTFPAIEAAFGSNIDLLNLENYSDQSLPAYIQKSNGDQNPITDLKATLGRVLFYDVQLSTDNTISCSSCHKQLFAFGDDAIASQGVNGETARHSMRLVNARFSVEDKFFWDERAASLEIQTTMPIQDHNEMGFSDENGDPDLDSLFRKLEAVAYYNELFHFIYGDEGISESRVQESIAQFIRSIQSFDSKFDDGRAMANNNGAPFQNFSIDENAGKRLFLTAPVFNNAGVRTDGGAGCAGCHQAPEFDIRPNTGNNGIIGNISGPGAPDLTVTRSPSLRDIIGSNGELNGGLMHTAQFSNLRGVINHYDSILVPMNGNPNLDPVLRPGGNLQRLRMTNEEKGQLEDFLRTLSGSNMYTDPRWSDPFL